MASERPRQEPSGQPPSPQTFPPEELLTFIELRPFTRRWQQLGLDDTDLQALQLLIMIRPKAGDVIAGTGGVRKLRFAPPQWRLGKRGALRVCYAYVEQAGTIVLGLVYAKGENDDLSSKEKTA